MSPLPQGRGRSKEPKMAKGQLRSTREARKPKKGKIVAVKQQPGSQVRQAASTISLGRKDK
ncbi:hypothetical protein NXC24_CH00295 [Rhizobium sp. NXC24]|nr:hypothetical protein NXC24_CH00295 [Rhizobium sp. NXC24]